MRAKIIEVLAHLSEPTLVRLASCHPFFNQAYLFRNAWQRLGIDFKAIEPLLTDHCIFSSVDKLLEGQSSSGAALIGNLQKLSEIDRFKEILPTLIGSHHTLFTQAALTPNFSFLEDIKQDFFLQVVDQLSVASEVKPYLFRILGQGRAVVNGRNTAEFSRDLRLATIQSQLTNGNKWLWTALELTESLSTIASTALQVKFPQLCSASQDSYLPQYHYTKMGSEGRVKVEVVVYLGDQSNEQNNALIQVISSYEVYLKANRPEPLMTLGPDSPRDIVLKSYEPGEFVLRIFPPTISVLDVPHCLQFIQEAEAADKSTFHS
jgi:hypothetical protein